MSRAVLLPATGDPYLLKYWLLGFEKVWGSEVDKVYVSLPVAHLPWRQKVNDFVIGFLSKNPKFEVWENKTSSLVDQFKIPVEKCVEDRFVYVQEDAFIFQPGALDREFKKMEVDGYDIVCSHQTQITDNYRFFWLNFLFLKTEDVKKTDMDFDIGVFEGGYHDIMGRVHIQLQQMSKLKHFIQQNTDEWCHVNSLSMINDYLFERKPPQELKLSGAGLRVELTKRIGWWKTLYDMFVGECGEIEEFNEEYDRAIKRIMRGVASL